MKNKIKEYLETISNNFKLLEGEIGNIMIASQLIISALEKRRKIIF